MSITKDQKIEFVIRTLAIRVIDLGEDINNKVDEILAQRLRWDRYQQIAEKLQAIEGITNEDALLIARNQIRAYLHYCKQFQAQLADVNFFEYVGQRQCGNWGFCKNYVDKTYSLKQIELLSNGTEYPVKLYGGGLECYHSWEPDPFYGYE